MKHLFLSKELSLLAKEKGFDEECFAWYSNIRGNNLAFVRECNYFRNSCQPNNFQRRIAAPLYQQIIDWFREKHGIRFKIEPTINNEVEVFIYQIGWRFIGRFEHDYIALDKAIEEAFKLI